MVPLLRLSGVAGLVGRWVESSLVEVEHGLRDCAADSSHAGKHPNPQLSPMQLFQRTEIQAFTISTLPSLAFSLRTSD